MSIDLLPQFPGQLGFTLHLSLGRACRVQPTDQRRIPLQASAQLRRTHAPHSRAKYTNIARALLPTRRR